MFELLSSGRRHDQPQDGGTGLGLSISRELARLLGGAIRLKSREGRAAPSRSSFRKPTIPAVRRWPIRKRPLPRLPPGASPEPAQLRKVEDDRDALTNDRRILLVIEDDETFATILRDLSREMGFQPIVAAAAEEALILAKRHMPSAIVLDVGLPDQSGLFVLDRFKRDVSTRHIPIHVVSGSDHAETALSLGAVGYMLKPVNREELVDVLQEAGEQAVSSHAPCARRRGRRHPARGGRQAAFLA